MWLWCRPAAVPPVQPPDWEAPFATGTTLKSKNKKTKKKQQKKKPYFSDVKKDKIMPFATTRMKLEIILSEVRKTNTASYHLHVESKIWHKWEFPSRRSG